MQVTHDLQKTYICDLGVAKIKYHTTMTTAVNAIGTYPYMAPEMFGASHRTTAVDIYSLGCLLIELFGQKRVWDGITCGIQIMQKVCGSYNVPPQMPRTDHLPLMYGGICKGCCELDPEQRSKIDDIINNLEDIKLSLS